MHVGRCYAEETHVCRCDQTGALLLAERGDHGFVPPCPTRDDHPEGHTCNWERSVSDCYVASLVVPTATTDDVAGSHSAGLSGPRTSPPPMLLNQISSSSL